MKTRKRKDSYLLLAVALLVVSLAVFLVSFFAEKNILNEREINVKLIVANETGIDLNKENISFMLVPGTSQSRNLIIENNYNFPIKIFFQTYGNISRFLSFENSIILPGEKKKIGVIASVLLNETYGEYNGKIIAIIKKDI